MRNPQDILLVVGVDKDEMVGKVSGIEMGEGRISHG